MGGRARSFNASTTQSVPPPGAKAMLQFSLMALAIALKIERHAIPLFRKRKEVFLMVGRATEARATLAYSAKPSDCAILCSGLFWIHWA
jgi:hypothetical protein